jgi:hypothetical protein
LSPERVTGLARTSAGPAELPLIQNTQTAARYRAYLMIRAAPHEQASRWYTSCRSRFKEKKVMARIRVVPETDEWLASQKERFDAPVRKKAFEIHCHHDHAACSAVTDWQAAKHGLELLPLAGIDETDREIRISACVANEGCAADSVITLRVTPHCIVAESANRFSVVDLPFPVRTDNVRATLDGDQLSVVAARSRLGANR